MSIEFFVLSDRPLASMDEWQRAIDAEHFPLKLDASRAVADLGGHLPADLRGEEAGFECDHFDAGEFMDENAGTDFGRRWNCLLAFRTGGDFSSLFGAYAAAASCAKATGGVMYDAEEGEVLSPEEALQRARDIGRDLAGDAAP